MNSSNFDFRLPIKSSRRQEQEDIKENSQQLIHEPDSFFEQQLDNHSLRQYQFNNNINNIHQDDSCLSNINLFEAPSSQSSQSFQIEDPQLLTQIPNHLQESNEIVIKLIELEKFMVSLTQTINLRLQKIEDLVLTVLQSVKKEAINSNDDNNNNNNNNPIRNKPNIVESPMYLPFLTLKFENIQLKWYTRRQYPEFRVDLINKETKEIFTQTEGWTLGLRLISGSSHSLSQFLHSPALSFPINQGRAKIYGLKFLAVSSRNGGFFQLEVFIKNPENTSIEPIRSPEIRVLSERLKNEAKVSSFEELSSTDELSRVPGIGKKYASRLSNAGIKTVTDLALIEPASQRFSDILEMIRKDRGSLTESKFLCLIENMKQIMLKGEENDSSYENVENHHQHHAKRRKTENEVDSMLNFQLSDFHESESSRIIKQVKEEEQ